MASAFVRLDAQAVGNHDFVGRIEQAHLPTGQVSRVRAAPHRVLRRSEHVARRRGDLVFANLQLSGRGLVEMPQGRYETAPMDLCLVSTSEPYSITHTAPFELISIAIPQDALPATLDPGILRLSQSAAGRELANVLAGLGALALQLPAANDALNAQILSTLSLVTQVSAEETDGTALLEAIQAHIARCHMQPELSAAPLAASFGITERKIHALFEETGQTVGSRIEAARLATAQSLLETTDLQISAIAARAGFRDPSYFARVFRRKHGVSPGAWRAAQLS
ncbi:helix-turn-helix domain-containing protein [uncultured Ruegeria sp.]|uniref:helix-turn-helix domain-containing protein n=1 Tax=uncultured Ruegeria sp. TaxID=259304 RepID=UPI002629B4D2|nr:helix-turn-helix domain-containing protein [uncultured Ruegeria sp.]